MERPAHELWKSCSSSRKHSGRAVQAVWFEPAWRTSEGFYLAYILLNAFPLRSRGWKRAWACPAQYVECCGGNLSAQCLSCRAFLLESVSDQLYRSSLQCGDYSRS